MKDTLKSTVFLPGALLFLILSISPGTADDGQTIGIGGFTSPLSYPGMDLVWREEFSGHTLDPATWSLTTGAGKTGRGQAERQFYQPENAELRDGFLVISARQESRQGSEYTAAKIVTSPAYPLRSGRIDVRARLPASRGLWPAVRLQGADGRHGAREILEMDGGVGRENTVHGTVHWKAGGGQYYEGASFTLPTGTFNDQFHLFSIVRQGKLIRWLVDDYEYFRFDLEAEAIAAFPDDFHISVSLAVGGDGPGPPGSGSVLPQAFVLDYIRVFQSR